MTAALNTCGCGCGELVRGRYRQGHNKRVEGGARWEVDDNGCWNWTGYLNKKGYAGGHAHRRNYERMVGPIPEGLQLDHLCGNRRCVNPDHLEPVTLLENVRRSRRAKLTPDQVAEIKARAAQGCGVVELGRCFGVHPATISDINAGRTWGDVEPAEVAS